MLAESFELAHKSARTRSGRLRKAIAGSTLAEHPVAERVRKCADNFLAASKRRNEIVHGRCDVHRGEPLAIVRVSDEILRRVGRDAVERADNDRREPRLSLRYG